MTNILAPDAKQQFFTNSGAPNAGGLLYTYAAGTTTPIATYTATGGTNTNPIVLNARGECDIWLLPNTGYKFVLEDAAGNVIWSVDQIFGSQLLTLFGGIDTGSANNYIVNFAANFTALTNGIVLYFIPANTNTAGSAINVNGLGNIPIKTPFGSPVPINQIVAGAPCGLLYYNGAFLLIFTPNQVPQEYQFTGTLTGFSGTAPSATVYLFQSGNKVLLNLAGSALTGSSNSTAMTLTGVPAAAQPKSIVSQTAFCQVLDSSNTYPQLGNALLIFGSGTINFYLGGTNGNFTASGTKGLPASWSLNYDCS